MHQMLFPLFLCFVFLCLDYSSLCVVSNDMTMIGMWINRANSDRIG